MTSSWLGPPPRDAEPGKEFDPTAFVADLAFFVAGPRRTLRQGLHSRHTRAAPSRTMPGLGTTRETPMKSLRAPFLFLLLAAGCAGPQTRGANLYSGFGGYQGIWREDGPAPGELTLPEIDRMSMEPTARSESSAAWL